MSIGGGRTFVLIQKIDSVTNRIDKKNQSSVHRIWERQPIIYLFILANHTVVYPLLASRAEVEHKRKAPTPQSKASTVCTHTLESKKILVNKSKFITPKTTTKKKIETVTVFQWKTCLPKNSTKGKFVQGLENKKSIPQTDFHLLWCFFFP